MNRFTIGVVAEELLSLDSQPDAWDLSEGFSSQAALKRAWNEGFEVLDSGKTVKAVVDKMLADGMAEKIMVTQSR